ncbi:hypothetical protein CY34DRAFT_109229 [Suillus luteus UH-Slu-Lm8-n1]|uniref:JmjC domain-containing protein n=1 Tax=Suillus luteus UH-Slu-Lm8-n1 TaxID=930992 RepID=A0A0C9ZIC0_9AGAM|nr:hypothetical protein CY34DRAFT_109229 [Suillus luteus UH-Slu-Lm8-n1]
MAPPSSSAIPKDLQEAMGRQKRKNSQDEPPKSRKRRVGSEQLQLQSVAEPAEGGYLAVVQDMSEEPTSTDLRRKEDLASSLISSEMPYGTETVRWPNGQVTVLPTVMLNGRNVLENDAKRVRQMAALPISLPTSPRVDHIDAAALQGGDLRNRVAAALRDDRCAVVRRAAEPGPEKLTLQYLHDEFGISDRLCSLHDMAKRAEDWTHPHKDGTIGRLLDGARYTDEQLCALDIPLPAFTIPSPFQTLDHAAVYAWGETVHEFPLQDTRPHPDVFLNRSWGLLHQAGIYTAPHHDSNGKNTFVKIVSGMKMWCVYHLDDASVPRDQAADVFHRLCDIDGDLSQLPEGLVAEVIILHAGDMLFMPPGKFHEVYTPLVTFATGGHFLSYLTMHLSEWSRFLDQLYGSMFTNQEHEDTLLVLRRMVVAIPRLSHCKLYHRATVALCTMVLNPGQYLSQRADEDGAALHQSGKGGKKSGKAVRTASSKDNVDSKQCVDRANEVANHVLQVLKLDGAQAASVLDDRPYDEVGDEVEFGDQLVRFQAY